mgnify:CR=1 FL=1
MFTLAQTTPNWLNGGTLKVAVWLIIIGAIAVGKIVKAAKEQAEQRRRLDAAKQAEIEALRTGRPVPVDPSLPERVTMSASNTNPQQSAAQRLEELAAQRRLKIEELRRARAAAASGKPPMQQPVQQVSRGTPPARPQQVTSRAPTPPQRVGQRPAQAPQPQAQRQQQQRPQQQRQQAKPQQRQQQPALRPPEPAQSEPTTHRLVPDAKTAPTEIPTEFTARRGVRIGNTTMTSADWRRALVLREILGPPVSMRRPEE